MVSESKKEQQKIQEALCGDQNVLIKIFLSEYNPLNWYDIYFKQNICVQWWVVFYILGKHEWDLKNILISYALIIILSIQNGSITVEIG